MKTKTFVSLMIAAAICASCTGTKDLVVYDETKAFLTFFDNTGENNENDDDITFDDTDNEKH